MELRRFAVKKNTSLELDALNLILETDVYLVEKLLKNSITIRALS